ncbi:radical SAM family heme chaperone HemW [Psychrosphaera aestuarii]|uniref:radical SAM family heme chaperone HemW n=1 Tax=Psychrosphaera aestuarii TaxID=1266052 RepID=UPI001FCF9949|nr:radical SAM family heme chaperone HemW [Psychrosphaera aestuarii]
MPSNSSNRVLINQLPPLSLYVHIPWCVQKCPYCDFNSHALKGGIPETEYVAHLLDDLSADLHFVQDRKLQTIFFGGGTPSLLSEKAMATLLTGIEQRIPFSENIEITLEANPGTLETNKFEGFAKAGVNRISIGVQSFELEKLVQLGRIHNSEEALKAAGFAHSSVSTFNLDLMHGLPNQSLEQALADVKQAIALDPFHISWYQLTIEPNTLFHSKPPVLPDDDVLWDIQQQGHELLTQAGYEQYEISAYSKPGHQCKHNLNYWQFGDYLGIGCGAHGKITVQTDALKSTQYAPQTNAQIKVIRTEKVKHPKGYMDLTKPYAYKQWTVEPDELPFEYFMNRLRLKSMFSMEEFEQRTGLAKESQLAPLTKALELGLLTQIDANSYKTTSKGIRYYNNLVDLFL